VPEFSRPFALIDRAAGPGIRKYVRLGVGIFGFQVAQDVGNLRKQPNRPSASAGLGRAFSAEVARPSNVQLIVYPSRLFVLPDPAAWRGYLLSP
jgi:hypothetical protein